MTPKPFFKQWRVFLAAGLVSAGACYAQSGFEICQGTQEDCQWSGAPDPSQPILMPQPPQPSAIVRGWQPSMVQPDPTPANPLREPCAATPSQAMARFAAAQNAGMSNRALEFYDWTGVSQEASIATVDRLVALGPGYWEEETIVASFGEVAPAQLSGTPAVRWVGTNGAVFSWRQQLGCWFLKFGTDPVATQPLVPVQIMERFSEPQAPNEVIVLDE